ncbi:MAG TPA: hypothetical protein VND93_29440 [Myxococcales bacterium]|nr:hypothetical protein [Myxococcales bacterium]
MANQGSRAAALASAFDGDEQLDAARALFEREGADLPVPGLAGVLRAAGLAAARPVAEGAPGELTGAARRDLPFDVPADLGLPVARAPAMVPAAVAGPYRGATGPFWVHLFGSVEAISIYAQGATQPTFVVTQGRPSVTPRGQTVIEMEGGSLWIEARALAVSSREGEYVGFTVERGTLAFPQRLSGTAKHLTYPGPLAAVLDVKPATPAAASAVASIAPPDRVRMAWEGAGPAIELGAGSATFGGRTLAVTGLAEPPELDAEPSVVLFPGAVSPGDWDAAALPSPLARFSGTTAIDGGWALPLVRPGPSSPSEATGPGMYLFHCRDPLQARWKGAPAEVSLAGARLIVRQGQVSLSSRHGAAPPGFAQTFRVWAARAVAGAPRFPVTIRCGQDFTFAFISDAGVGDGLYATCAAEAALDRPATIRGVPLQVPPLEPAFFGLQQRAAGTFVRVSGAGRVPPEHLEVLALRNALLAVGQPMALALEGALDEAAVNVDQGQVLLSFNQRGWLPTLPDPYVANHGLGLRGDAAVPGEPSLIAALISWTAPEAPAVSFSGALGGPLGTRASQTEDPVRPVQQQPEQVRVPTQTAQGALLASVQIDPAAGHGPGVFSSVGGRGLRLLDVSTNKDLLGVELVGSRMGPGFSLQGLDVLTPATGLRVIALPQVQWEPVRTLDRDQDIPHLGLFPSPLASVTDGGATQLAVQSARLVPVIPDLAVDAALDELARGAPAGLFTTLPFGIQAVLQLRSSPDGGRNADAVARNQPSFPKPGLQGGAQLAFIAESGPSGRDRSSTFDGYARQLHNGVSLATGAPLDISVLGSVVDPADSVQEMFNNQFDAGGARPGVPVTRLDISGYGGSCFSDWLDRNAAYAEAAKVQFQVMVGRTALEVVKFATVLHPWGIRLTRSVTIERRGGGGVIRRDSGWQASSPGLFQVPGTSYTVHPGLLRGLFDVRNIRSTGLAPISFIGQGGKKVTLAPKFFDARARIDGLEGASELRADGLLGFLQIEPVGQPLAVEDLRTLLDQQGPAGGPVDGTVQVGGSGFRVRATRIEVGVTDGTAGPELTGVVRSAPIFRQEGAWSAVRMPGPSNPHGDAEAVAAGEVGGLPIVREGQLVGLSGDDMVLGPQSDYRFAGAADVHRPDDPVWEYGLLHTSPAHVFLFPRPHVAAGVPELRTRSRPRFADFFARCTSKGLFPPAANGITLPPNALAVDPATGGFRLRDPVSIPAPRPPLIIAQRGSDVMQVDYGETTLSLSIERNGWHLDMPRVQMWSDILGISRVAGMRTQLVAGTNARAVLSDISLLLMPVIEKVLTFLPGFDARPPMGPVDLGASNNVVEHKLAVAADRIWKIPPGDALPQLKLSVGGKLEFGWSEDDAPPPDAKPGTTYAVGLLATAGAEGKIPIFGGPVYFMLGAAIEIGGAVELHAGEPAKMKSELDLKAYFGFGLQSGPFDGSISFGYHLTIESGTWKNGIFGKLQAELDVKIAKVSVEGELSGQWFDDNSHPPYTHAALTETAVQVNVELAFVAFHASYQYSDTKYLN